MKKFLLLIIVSILLCGCAAKTPEADDPAVPEEPAEKYSLLGMVERTDNPERPVYIHPSLKEENYYSMDLGDGSQFEGFETGDAVRLTLRKEKVKATDKNTYYDIYKLDSVERSNEMFQNKTSVYELIDMEPTEIVIKESGCDELREVILTDQDDINEVMNSLKDITVYDDGFREYGAGYSMVFTFRDGTQEVSVREAFIVTIKRDGKETEYSYRYPEEMWLSELAEKYLPE